jgi:hypothetical protein
LASNKLRFLYDPLAHLGRQNLFPSLPTKSIHSNFSFTSLLSALSYELL